MRTSRLLPAALFALAGCAADEAPTITTPAGHVQHAIYGGAGPDAPEHAAVIGIHQRTSSGVSASPFCSGTLITPDVVITAAHCLDTARKGKNFRTSSPDAVAVYFGDDAASDANPSIYPVSETLIHPGYDRNALLNDIALMRLAVPNLDVTPVPHLPAALPVSVGEPINFAGFGYDESGDFGVKLQVDGTVEGLGCSVNGCPRGDDAATQFSYTQPVSGPCSGDSGGPAFAYRGGSAFVAGLTSFGDSYCTIYGVSTRVDAFQGFVDDFIGGPIDPGPSCGSDGVCEDGCAADPDCDVAPEPEPEPPADACGDGVCGGDESCDGRAGTAICPSDCAGRTNGRPAARYCYVGDSCEGPGCP